MNPQTIARGMAPHEAVRQARDIQRLAGGSILWARRRRVAGVRAWYATTAQAETERRMLANGWRRIATMREKP